ncbi:haloacid dehalogenase type II [Glycomyces terrestris]|uniref:Haloacid dehalogenase type II n=1 Tax=Glycomyces terrestris TaxID=2493553 RepID=A0A426UVB7_9ACTN|nr:haloacid dehalogenase type II [Glycomyces terrestris]RRR98296.1 haloacid dehalogenase type II [Glycomyces terrestris]
MNAPIEAVVFDVLGTMVDETRGLAAAIREAAPGADTAPLLALWQRHIEREQDRIVKGERPFATTDVLDREAAEFVAEHAGITDAAVLDRLATAGRRHPAWDDAAAGLERIARRRPVLALSNAGRAALLHLTANAGLRWHQALTAEDARTYKPAPEVYRLAVEAVGCPPERLLMVAAHAWDLRGAQAIGMRTAYVRRPVGDPPGDGDAFDWHAESLGELAEALGTR